jgi:hypothetical protein
MTVSTVIMGMTGVVLSLLPQEVSGGLGMPEAEKD